MRRTLIGVLAVIAGVPAAPDTLVRDLPEIKVQPKVGMKAWAFDLQRVRLLDGPFKSAMERDGKYLLTIDSDRLLSRFRRFSGLQPKGEEYKGWEAQTISGHTLGHYLSAVSMMYAATGDRRFLERANYIVDEVALVQQKKGTGFVGGFPDADRLWKEIAAGDIRSQPFNLNGIWVPWYTTHKLLAGLMDAYTLCNNAKARDVLIKLADFTIELTDHLDDEQMQRMLATEQGGVLESFTDVYAITGDAKYLKLAQRFYHRRFMDAMAEQKDILTGLHGNTNIPKVIGAARQYEVTGDEKFRTIARFFWERVVRERSYVNGGHGDDEHFFPPEKFEEHLTSRTAETCNTYNMLRLTRHLFSWTASAEAADFYERALYNHILASQDSASGMMIYLCSLKPGHFKVFNTPFDSFWCCTGTGMENHAKYGDSIYFHDDEGLYVNLFIASALDWKEKGLKIRQSTRFPEEATTRLEFEAAKPVALTLRIRHPGWAAPALTLSVNGKRVEAASKPGEYASIRREWKSGDRIEVTFPMRLRAEPLPGAEDRIALLYGPVVLAGTLGREGMAPPIPFAKEQLDYDLVPSVDVPVIVADDRNPVDWLRAVPGKPLVFTSARPRLFRLPGTAAVPSPELVPFYRIHDQRYTVYWHAFSEAGWKKSEAEFSEERRRMKALEPRLIDVFRPGEIQSEGEHNFEGPQSHTGERNLRKFRETTRPESWFSYEMKVIPDGPVELMCSFWGGQPNRTFDVLVDGVKVATQALDQNPNQFFDATYALAPELTRGKQKVTVKFQAMKAGRLSGAGPLFRAATLKKE